jgi:DNA-binding response OmpR family regulator
LFPRPTSDLLHGRRRIVICDEDRRVVSQMIRALREDGHAVFHAYDALSATQLAASLDPVDLLISNTVVEGMDGVELIHLLRREKPALPILYIANDGRSPPGRERRLPPEVPILREPFTDDELRAAVGRLLDGGGGRARRAGQRGRTPAALALACAGADPRWPARLT